MTKARSSSAIERPAGIDPDAAVYLVVTTAHRGVFGGYGRPSDASSIRLEHVRMAVSWTADVGGVVGLAASGPSKGCRIGPAAPAITLRDVTAVMEASPTAEAAWEDAPWSR